MRISQQISSHDERIVLLHFERRSQRQRLRSHQQDLPGIIDSKKYFIVALMENVTFVSSPSWAN